MHPRVCLHQVGFLSESTAAFIGFCREIGVRHMTLATSHLLGPGMLDEAVEALRPGGTAVANLVHVFAGSPSIELDDGRAAADLDAAIEAAATLGAPNVYLVSGARGSLDWEAAAARFAALIAPCRTRAGERGVRLLVETANLLYADLHIAHTLDDTINLAELAGIGVCIDLGACWFEGGLAAKFRRAMPITGLVQVSDYVLGDRSTPCRAVVGDGAVPLERLIGQLLQLGYDGVFDLELIGPRIDGEGHRAALRRAAVNLSAILTRLGG